jgi:hypothetical protein
MTTTPMDPMTMAELIPIAALSGQPALIEAVAEIPPQYSSATSPWLLIFTLYPPPSLPG